jgi:DNA modification methylase
LQPKADLKVEWWPIENVKPYAKNPRLPSDKAVRKVMASIKEFGWRQPIVVDAKGIIVAGHKRWEAATKMKLLRVPVHVAAGLTSAQIRQYRIMDNRSQDDSEWDQERLAAEVFDLSKLPDIDLALTGFEPPELAAFLAQAGAPQGLTGAPQGLTGEDDAPEPPVIPVSKLGDLWLLGKHRLLCGDSTDAEAVKRLMAGEKAGLMATDPPYGVALRLEDNHEASNSAKGIDTKYRHFEKIMGDDLDGGKLQDFLERAFAAAKLALADNAAWYLWHAQLTQGFFAAAAAAAQLLVHRQIIWAKPHFVFGRGDYHWQHELCFYGWRQGHRPPFLGQHNQSTVWQIDEGGGSIRQEQVHPTQKPVALFQRPISNHLEGGAICYEPFGGSGSQWIAAQSLGVRCFGLELAPQYVDVIVDRWEKFTGQSATLEGDGRTFRQISDDRGSEDSRPKTGRRNRAVLR